MITAGAPKAGSIALTGFMASGKTSVGGLLALALGWDLVDLDADIERDANAGIPTIFEREGEAGFRAREGAALERAASRDGIVLSTGGGAVLAESNREILHDRFFTVWLVVTAGEAVRRAAASGAVRPLLSVPDPLATAEILLSRRLPFYRECAQAVVDTEGRIAADIAEEVYGLYARTL